MYVVYGVCVIRDILLAPQILNNAYRGFGENVYELITDFTRYCDISILRNSCADVRVTDRQTDRRTDG